MKSRTIKLWWRRLIFFAKGVLVLVLVIIGVCYAVPMVKSVISSDKEEFVEKGTPPNPEKERVVTVEPEAEKATAPVVKVEVEEKEVTPEIPAAPEPKEVPEKTAFRLDPPPLPEGTHWSIFQKRKFQGKDIAVLSFPDGKGKSVIICENAADEYGIKDFGPKKDGFKVIFVTRPDFIKMLKLDPEQNKRFVQDTSGHRLALRIAE